MCGPVPSTPESVAGVMDSLVTDKNQRKMQTENIYSLTKLTRNFFQGKAPNKCPILHFAALDNFPGYWSQMLPFQEIRPILSRGNEHACVLVWAAPKDRSTRFYYTDFAESLNQLGHWFAAVWDSKYHREIGRQIGGFSGTYGDFLEVPPDHSFVLRIHPCTPQSGLFSLSLPRRTVMNKESSDGNELNTFYYQHIDVRQESGALAPVMWTSDIASRLLFSTIFQELDSIESPKDADPELINLFLPVPNKDLAYAYAPCNGTKQSTMTLYFPRSKQNTPSLDAVQQSWSIFETHYDACGHFLRCIRHDIEDNERCIEFDLQPVGSKILLLRIVPQSQSAFQILQRTSGDQVQVSWVKKASNGNVLKSAKQCPIWTIQPIKTKELLSNACSSRKKKKMSSVPVHILCALKSYWQEKNARGKDDHSARQLKNLGCKDLTVVLKEAHHYNVCKSISTEEMVEFLLSNSVGSSDNHTME